MIMQHVSHASNLSYVVLGCDFNAHYHGNLEDTPVEQLDWQLPARVPVTLDAMLLKCTMWQESC
jgi:hypothetical protein